MNGDADFGLVVDLIDAIVGYESKMMRVSKPTIKVMSEGYTKSNSTLILKNI